MRSNPLWVITTFFNPTKCQTKAKNYRDFYQHLTVPLVTVELSFDGHFELGQGDATILVRVTDGDVMWQRERLQNLAIEHVPTSVPYIAWLDCDVIFQDDRWNENACEALKTVPWLQLFSEVWLLENRVLYSDDGSIFSKADVKPSYMSARQKGIPCPSGQGRAWAARSDILRRHGFYDCSIIGGGDMQMIDAALGDFHMAGVVDRLNVGPSVWTPQQIAHYLAWAKPLRQSLLDCASQPVGCLDGRIHHLWHGTVKDRRYCERFFDLAKFGFDPNVDLKLGPQGAWQWATPKHEMHQYVRNYFFSRNEDGRQKGE